MSQIPSSPSPLVTNPAAAPLSANPPSAPAAGGLVIDGITYTPDMIQALRTEAAQNREIAEAAKVIYTRESSDPSAAEAAYRRLLTAHGWTAEDVNAEVARVYSRNSTPPQSDSRPMNQPPANQPPPSVDPTAPRQGAAAPQAPDRNSALSQEAVSHIILDNMRNAARNELMADPEFTAFRAHIATRDGEDAARKFVESHVEQAYSSLRTTGSRRIEAEGHVRSVFGESLGQMAKAAVKDVVGKARQYLGDPKRLGKSQMAVAGEDPFLFTAKPPVPPARFQEGMPQAILERGIDDRMTDALSRSVAATLAPSGL